MARSFILLLCVLMFTLNVRAAPRAYRLSKDGVSFCLLGTVHQGPSISVLGPQTLRCLLASRQVMVEAAHSPEIVKQALGSYSDYSRDNRQVIPRPIWERFKNIVSDRALRESVRHLEPGAAAVVAFFIYNTALNDRINRNLDVTGMDFLDAEARRFSGNMDDEIVEVARIRKISVVELDAMIHYDLFAPLRGLVTDADLAFLFKKLFVSNHELSDLARTLTSRENLSARLKGKSEWHRAYVRGFDVDQLNELEKSLNDGLARPELEDFLERGDELLLERDLRHLAWIPIIENAIREHQPTFVAVGKKHVESTEFGNDQNLLAQFLQRGYIVERLDYDCGDLLTSASN